MFTRQHQVQYQKVHRVVAEVGIHRLAAFDATYLKPLLLQVRLGQLTQFRIIIYDQ